MATFLGTYTVKFDDRGRVFVPSHFRKLISDDERKKVVLRKDMRENCLIVYPEDVWNKKVEAMQQKFNEYKGKNAAALAAFTGKAEWVEIDEQGRMLLKKNHLAQIGIENFKNASVDFEGRIDRFAVWNNATHTEAIMSDEELANLMEEIM